VWQRDGGSQLLATLRKLMRKLARTVCHFIRTRTQPALPFPHENEKQPLGGNFVTIVLRLEVVRAREATYRSKAKSPTNLLPPSG